MPKVFTSKTQKIGELGEKIAVEYLKKRGFSIIEINFTCGYGEIDIIAFSPKTKEREERFCFIEVKTVSQETLDKYDWRPEQNFHQHKLLKIMKTVYFYKSQNKYLSEDEILLLTVVLDPETHKARVSLETIQ